jgi:hypothetical protein
MTAAVDKRLVKKCLEGSCRRVCGPGAGVRAGAKALKKLQSCKLAEALPVQHLTPDRCFLHVSNMSILHVRRAHGFLVVYHPRPPSGWVFFWSNE